MGEWREVKLDEVIKFGNGKKKPITDGKIPIYGGNGILGYSSEANCNNETIIIGRVGAYCGSVYYENNPIWVSDNALSAKPKNNNDTKFLYYFLKNASLNQHAGGSSHPLVTQTLLNSLKYYFCINPKEQKAIAGVLSSLDDKIDLLHRQNKTLEALAQTLFRQWFIEEAKEGWEEKPLSEICEIRNGFAFKSKDYKNNGRVIVRTKNFNDGFVDLDGVVYIALEKEQEYIKYHLQQYDFLLVMVGASIGKSSIVTSDILPALQNQNMWNFRSLGTISQHYLNFALKNIVQKNLGSASGSAREFFQKGQFYKFLITIPNKEKLDKFDEYVNNTYEKLEINRKQIKTLENMRNTLLPKLMSGEVKIKLEKEK